MEEYNKNNAVEAEITKPEPDNNKDVHYNAPQPPRPERGDAAPATPPQKVRRVGTVAFGLVLVAVGTLLLARVLVPGLDITGILKFTPVVLVVLGIEVLIYAVQPNVKLKYDFLSMIVCFCILVGIGSASILTQMWEDYGYPAQLKNGELQEQADQAIYNALQASPQLTDAIRDQRVSVYTKDYGLGSSIRVSFTLKKDFADAQEFAAICRQVMDTCKTTGLEIDSYYFESWNDQTASADGSATLVYCLDSDNRWSLDASADKLVEYVGAYYWYDDIHFSSLEEFEQYKAQQRYDAYGEYDEYDQHMATSEQALTDDALYPLDDAYQSADAA